MALVVTTLSAALAINSNEAVVASAASIVPGRYVQIDQEMMQVAKNYTTGTTIPLLRAKQGTVQSAHVITANVVHGDAVDFSSGVPGGPAVAYGVMRGVFLQSITASQTVSLPPAGCDWRLVLNGTSVINLVVPAPTADMDGTMLCVVSNGSAAHTVQFTSGLGGAGSSYDILTNNATGRILFLVVAANLTWQLPSAAAISGTATNLISGVA